MSVAVRPWKKPGKWQVDIIFHKPDGERVRDQKVVSAKTEGMAKRWGDARSVLPRRRAAGRAVRPARHPVVGAAAHRFDPLLDAVALEAAQRMVMYTADVGDVMR
jgi:hypothetical protein